MSMIPTLIFDQVAKDFLTLGQAARTIGVTRVTLWRWMKAGKIEGYRLGREVFIEKMAVEKLKRSRARGNVADT